jgi:hypothetical protein
MISHSYAYTNTLPLKNIMDIVMQRTYNTIENIRTGGIKAH